jgi:hypothetical protein
MLGNKHTIKRRKKVASAFSFPERVVEYISVGTGTGDAWDSESVSFSAFWSEQGILWEAGCFYCLVPTGSEDVGKLGHRAFFFCFKHVCVVKCKKRNKPGKDRTREFITSLMSHNLVAPYSGATVALSRPNVFRYILPFGLSSSFHLPLGHRASP